MVLAYNRIGNKENAAEYQKRLDGLNGKLPCWYGSTGFATNVKLYDYALDLLLTLFISSLVFQSFQSNESVSLFLHHMGQNLSG